jgi:hypothetical protein
VLARTVHNRAELTAMTRFGTWELWVIRHLVEPFERIASERLPQAGTAHRLMLEAAGRRGGSTTSTATSSPARCTRSASSNR